MNDENVNGWNNLIVDLTQRMKKAFLTPSFILAFLGVIILCGSCGIWLPIVMSNKPFVLRSDSFFTYSISILASIVAEIFLKDSTSKSLKMLFFLFIPLSIIFLFLGIQSDIKATWFSYVGVTIALLIWFITNADDAKYDEIQSPQSPLGGKISGANGLSGKGL